jgi:hypothetical protein
MRVIEIEYSMKSRQVLIERLANGKRPSADIVCTIHRADGAERRITLSSRLDTERAAH